MLAAIEAAIAQALAEFDAATEQLLVATPEESRAEVEQLCAEQRASLAAEWAQYLANTTATLQANIAAMLPALRSDAETSQQCDAVICDGQASTLVDVSITKANGTPVVVVRCTPDCVFVTANGNAQAAALVGAEILRVHANGTADTFVVTSVVPVNLAVPVPVYRVQGDALASYCVGTDSTVAAIVRV